MKKIILDFQIWVLCKTNLDVKKIELKFILYDLRFSKVFISPTAFLTVFEIPIRYFISINIQVKLKMYYFEGNSIIIIIKL